MLYYKKWHNIKAKIIYLFCVICRKRNGMKEKEIHCVGDIIDVGTLQNIQDNFAKAMSLAFITVDYKGRPITRPSGFTTFCTCGRENVAFKEMCFQCDAHGGLHSAITGQPYVYRCHADLVDFAVPLVLQGSYVGAVLGGQVKLPAEELEQLDYLIPQQTDWQRDPTLREAHDAIKVVVYEKIEASVTLMRDMIQFLLEREYEKMSEHELAETNRELLEEKAQRITLEEMLEKAELSTIRNRLDFNFILYALNVASRLAYQEKSGRTESIIYDASDMMRYILSNSNSRIVMLEEELAYVEQMLRIQKADLGEQFTYTLDVLEEYQKIACPFMFLQPLVENAIKHATDSDGGAGDLSICGEAVGNDLCLKIRNGGSHMSPEFIEAILDTEGYRDENPIKMSLYNINRKLKGYFGHRYGLEIQNLDNPVGTEVSILLPLNSRGILH